MAFERVGISEDGTAVSVEAGINDAYPIGLSNVKGAPN